MRHLLDHGLWIDAENRGWGFFAWLLKDSYGIMTAIIHLFVLGGTATGLGATLNPSDLL